MEDSKPVGTPMCTSTKLDKDEEGIKVEEKKYRDIEILEPPPVAPKKKTITRSGKVKQTAQRKLDIQTAESSDEQLDGQNSEENIVGRNEEPEQADQGDKTVTRSSAKRKRSAKRKSTPQSKKKQSADPTDDQQNEENTTGSKKLLNLPPGSLQGLDLRLKMNLLVPPIPETNEAAHQKEPRTEPTRPTTGDETTPASSSQPKDKGKAPVTEEASEDSDEETEEEEDPAQYRLARRRPGSSKITI
nr:nucleolar and coiled-body phosphoprotein 1-like [Coffea arabica]